MSQQFGLEVLHHILNQFSENVSRDCSRIIDKLLKSLSAPHLNDFNIQYKKVFASVLVLLNLYEKLQQESKDKLDQSEFPLHITIHSIQNVLQCNKESCKLPVIEVQCNILSIISLLFKNALSQNNLGGLIELGKFYDYTLLCIYNRDDNKDCKADCLIFKLKIINSIYHAFNTFAHSNIKFQEIYKPVNKIDECKVFGDLVLYQNNDVAVQIMSLIPEYINCFKSCRVVEVIWKQISESITNSEVNYSRVLAVLCQAFDLLFEKSTLKDNIYSIDLLLEDSNYWKLLQMALVEEDSLKRKQGLYLLKRAIGVLNSSNANIECHKERLIFSWDAKCKDELYEIYTEIIIIFEFLEEQQVHIIQPIFGLIEMLCKKITECGKVSFSWILLIYKKALMHESTQIVKWALSGFLKLSEDFFSHEYIVRETVELIITTLNNMNLYYNEGWNITSELTHFLNKIIHLETSKIFFTLFIKCLCHQVWSAEALFFVTYSLPRDESCSYRMLFWGHEEVFDIKEFISKAFKTHNKIIRTGVQCQLLQAVSYFTDHRDVPLETVILLISRFPLGDILHFGRPAWDVFIKWLQSSYPDEEFKSVIEKYKRGELEREFNEKCMSLVFILIYQMFGNFEFSSKMNYLQEMLLSFKEIDKRVYCSKILQDKYLSVIVHLYEANVNNCFSGLIQHTLPFARDFIVYTQVQLHQISGLQDFNACQFYLNAFESIVKTLVRLEADNEYVKDLFSKVLNDFEVACKESTTSYMEMYYKMKLLNVILEFNPLKVKSGFLGSYLLAEVNEPLKKGNDYSSQGRDRQTLWGKINSEVLEIKWRILEHLIRNKIINIGPPNTEGCVWITEDDLGKLCVDALNTGGYGALCPVMSVLKNLLPGMKNVLEVRKVIESVWTVISDRRKTEEFKLFIKNFIEMLFQEALIRKGDSTEEILLKFTDIIFSDSSLAVVNIFLKHVQQIDIPDISVNLFCHILGKGLLFGPVQKKDEKLTNEVCSRIQFLKINQTREIGDFNLSQEIRARAVQKILMLDKSSETHKTAAKNLIKTLLKMESEINKNRVRYFGDSHTHRVKHRLFQALLLLEPLLEPNEKEAIELSRLILDCLMNENSQPSVRYLQEWLLIRMLVRHSQAYSTFCTFKYSIDDVEISRKGLCSLMVVTFHLCQLLPSEVMEERICSGLSDILFLCFHQHFEVRLCALVVFIRLYWFAESRKLERVIKAFEYIYVKFKFLLLVPRKGNFSRNLVEQSENFFLKTFKPLEHYSLETIYMDLPRLTNAGLDERISADIFQYCGVDSYKLSIPLRDEGEPLKCVHESERCMKKTQFEKCTNTDDHKSDEILSNYQKKIVPKKPLVPVWDENDSNQQCTLRKDGLIVVASLIDRMPNLGGLARTCEIFGASEYVINSLRYIEDKQFTSLSVTAEKWIPVREVKTQNLLDFILEMKQSGYTVIGAEQALHSLPLGAVKFPKKSLLLLGNEKEGIPPNLLPLLDICVEIPQLGIIRSLNVHVTGALFIWEYAKQNLLHN